MLNIISYWASYMGQSVFANLAVAGDCVGDAGEEGGHRGNGQAQADGAALILAQTRKLGFNKVMNHANAANENKKKIQYDRIDRGFEIPE